MGNTELKKKDSIKFYYSTFQLKELSPSDMILYSYIQHATNTNWVYETNHTKLYKSLGFKKSTFYRSIDRLTKLGYIKADGDKLTSTRDIDDSKFIKLYFYVLNAKLSLNTKLVLHHILNYINDGKEFYQSNITIQNALALSIRTVMRSIKELNDLNLITKSYPNSYYKRKIELNRDVLKDFISNKVVDTKPTEIVQPEAPNEPEKPTEVIKQFDEIKSPIIDKVILIDDKPKIDNDELNNFIDYTVGLIDDFNDDAFPDVVRESFIKVYLRREFTKGVREWDTDGDGYSPPIIKWNFMTKKLKNRELI